MDYSSTLTAQLNALTTTLGNPCADLQAILDVLVDDLSASIPSFLGLTMSLPFDGFDVTINAFDPDPNRKARSSLALPLDLGATTDNPCCTVVFYACKAGALVQLAAGFQRVNGMDPRVVLDGPLPSSMPRSGIDGLPELSAVNRAIGVLITRGYFPDEARAELRRRVCDGFDSVPDVARRVLLSTNSPRPCDPIPALTVGRRPVRLSTGPGRPRR